MLGFTLSKINLLIFVVAVFSIVLFFIYGFSGILVENIAKDYIRIHANDAFTLVGSPALCAAQIHYLKDSIESSSGNTGRGMYYIINIKKGIGKNGMNKLIFALAPRKTPNEYLAAASFDVNADIYFFDFQELKENPCDTDHSSNCRNIKIYDSNSLLDPQAAFPVNAYVILKEVNNGKTSVYIVPCSNRRGAECEELLGYAGNKIREGGFNCSFN